MLSFAALLLAAPLLDASALSALSRASPPRAGDEVTVLREEVDARVDGKEWVRSHRLVYRIDDPVAVEGWSGISVDYAPWEEERPKIVARVLAKDGRVHDLDPKTLSESAVGRDGDVYTDRVRIAGPLPAVASGSIVEQIVERRARPERALPFERVALEFGGPRTIYTHLRVDAPANAVVRADGLHVPKPDIQKKDGRQIWTWSRSDLAARDRPEPWSTPENVVPDGFIAVSVGHTWNDVATAYSRIVADALRGFDARAVLARDLGLDPEKLARAPRNERIQRILDAVGARVRYTGLELGDAAVIPRAPDVTLERRFGDCKDLATLVVALLRAVGVEAEVALVSTRLLPVADALPRTASITRSCG